MRCNSGQTVPGVRLLALSGVALSAEGPFVRCDSECSECITINAPEYISPAAVSTLLPTRTVDKCGTVYPMRRIGFVWAI